MEVKQGDFDLVVETLKISTTKFLSFQSLPDSRESNTSNQKIAACIMVETNISKPESSQHAQIPHFSGGCDVAAKLKMYDFLTKEGLTGQKSLILSQIFKNDNAEN